MVVAGPTICQKARVSLKASLSRSTSISSYCYIKFQAMVNTVLDNDLSYYVKMS